MAYLFQIHCVIFCNDSYSCIKFLSPIYFLIKKILLFFGIYSHSALATSLLSSYKINVRILRSHKLIPLIKNI